MIVITGASGHIGNVLVRRLIQQNEEVRAVIPPFEEIRSLEGLEVEKVTGDVRDIKSLIKAFRGAEVVYHLAGMVSILPGKADLIYQINVEGTKNVIKACWETGVGRLVYTSSVHAFVESPQGKVIDETAEIDPYKLADEYAKSKARATLEVKKSAKRGLNTVIVHPSGVIGPYEFKLSFTGQIILDYLKGKLPAYVSGGYDFVDVRDVVEGLILACNKGRIGESYILSGEQISVEEIMIILEKLTGIKKPIRLPNWFARMLAPIFQFYSMLKGVEPIFTSYAIQTLNSNSVISHEKATRELGYLPRSIRETIKDTVAWFRDKEELLSG